MITSTPSPSKPKSRDLVSDWRSRPKSTTTATASSREKALPNSATNCKQWIKRSTRKLMCGGWRTPNLICWLVKSPQILGSDFWTQSSPSQSCQSCKISKCRYPSKPSQTPQTLLTRWIPWASRRCSSRATDTCTSSCMNPGLHHFWSRMWFPKINFRSSKLGCITTPKWPKKKTKPAITLDKLNCRRINKFKSRVNLE